MDEDSEDYSIVEEKIINNGLRNEHNKIQMLLKDEVFEVSNEY